MKKNYLLLFFIAITIAVTAQNNIGIGTTSPNASAILELKASNKGLLMPRTSTNSRNSIVNPAKGLLIYDSTTSSFWFHNGSAWVQIGASGNGWSLTGNTGTNPANDFIGTTDEKPLVFKVNNSRAGYLDYDVSKGNTSFGFLGLFSNTSGTSNTVNGMYGLYLNASGTQNTATGYASLYSNINGNYNSAHGAAVLNYNTDGIWNTATGAYAMYLNTHGGYNTATGGYTLQSNLTGVNNVANGYGALNKNTSGHSNVAIGIFALANNTDRSNLVAVGDSALYNNVTNITEDFLATQNTAVGSKALYSNTTGFDNTANGYLALYSNTNGSVNTANGVFSLYHNISGDANTANGAAALYSSATGYYNTATGYHALYFNSTGSNNAANGVNALYQNTTGFANTASGTAALYSNTTGTYNTALGQGAGVSTGNLTNATAIGHGAIADASNKVRVGDGVVTSIGGSVSWTTFPSDGRYKKNIKEDVKGLSFINSLHPITYSIDIKALDEYFDKGRKHDSAYEKMKKDMQLASDEASNIVYNGFIAQDVEKAALSVGYNFSGVDKPKTQDGLYGLRYAEFVVPLVKAVQEQQVIIEDLNKKIGTQQQMIEELKKETTDLKDQLKKMTEIISKK